MEQKLVAVLFVVLGAILVSSVLIGQQDQIVKNIYATSSHTVTLADNTTITTPEPFLSPALQVQIWSLAPIGVFIGAGLTIFLMFMNKKK